MTAARKLKTAIRVVALAIRAAACQIPGAGEPPNLYTLSPKSTFAPDLPRVDWQLIIETPIAAAGLNTAIACAGLEGTIVEMSWYGDRPVEVGLGGAFHSRRLRLVSSQVGRISPGRRPRWDHGRRTAAALRLLDLPALDLLVAEEIAFEDAPRELPRILAPGAHGLAPVVRYPHSD